jgi:hypothetical protein
LGVIYHEIYKYENAILCFEEALTFAKVLCVPEKMTKICLKLIFAYEAVNDNVKIEKYVKMINVLCDKYQITHHKADVAFVLGKMKFKMDLFKLAEENFEESSILYAAIKKQEKVDTADFFAAYARGQSLIFKVNFECLSVIQYYSLWDRFYQHFTRELLGCNREFRFQTITNRLPIPKNGPCKVSAAVHNSPANMEKKSSCPFSENLYGT